MSFFDNLKHEAATQFIEIIQWLDDTPDTLVYRFPVYNAEIKMGAKLTVRENQVAVFINEGKAADLFTPGLYTLTTETIPILTALRGWKYGFQSPFKADVYFFNARRRIIPKSWSRIITGFVVPHFRSVKTRVLKK